MNSTLTFTARETAAVYESEAPGEPLDSHWLGQAYEIDSAARKIGRTGYAAYERAVTVALAGLRRTAAARALGSISTPRKARSSAANGRKGGRAKTVYTLTSAKGTHGTVAGYRAAVARAREVQSEMQAAYGVDVSRPDGRTVYTAR